MTDLSDLINKSDPEPKLESPEPFQDNVIVPETSILATALSVDDLSPYVKALVYGEPGAGKTVFAADSPAPLILDVEGSTEALINHPDLRARSKVIPLRDWNKLGTVLYELKTTQHPYETVVIDTISELQRVNMDQILIRAAEVSDGKQDPFLPNQGHYKKSTEMLRRIITAFKDLDMHVIVLAHVSEEKDEFQRVTLRPEITPKLANTLKGVFGVQAYLQHEIIDVNGEQEFKNWLISRQTPNIQAKNRIGNLPSRLDMPTFNHLVKARQEQLAKK